MRVRELMDDLLEISWQVIAMVALVGFMSIIYQFLTADRAIRFYYMQFTTNERMYVVGADIDWLDDISVAAIIDPDEDLKFMNEANKALNR